MSYLRLAVTAAILFFCACAVQESQALDWKSLPGVQEFFRSNPRARLMAAGPFDDVIDLIIQLIIKLIETILAQPIRDQLATLNDRISLLEGTSF